MRVLVAHASRYGATQAIAERIAEKLTEAGQEAQARPVKSVTDLADHQAFVIGSAVYFGKWVKDGTEFVRRRAIRRWKFRDHVHRLTPVDWRRCREVADSLCTRTASGGRDQSARVIARAGLAGRRPGDRRSTSDNASLSTASSWSLT